MFLVLKFIITWLSIDCNLQENGPYLERGQLSFQIREYSESNCKGFLEKSFFTSLFVIIRQSSIYFVNDVLLKGWAVWLLLLCHSNGLVRKTKCEAVLNPYYILIFCPPFCVVLSTFRFSTFPIFVGVNLMSTAISPYI